MHALSDTMPSALQLPVKHGVQREFCLQATFVSGVPTLDTANSDDGVAITGDTGAYDVTFPNGGKRGHFVGYMYQQTEVGDMVIFQVESFDFAAGTFSLESTVADGGTAADPPDGRLFLTWKVKMS